MRAHVTAVRPSPSARLAMDGATAAAATAVSVGVWGDRAEAEDKDDGDGDQREAASDRDKDAEQGSHRDAVAAAKRDNIVFAIAFLCSLTDINQS